MAQRRSSHPSYSPVDPSRRLLPQRQMDVAGAGEGPNDLHLTATAGNAKGTTAGADMAAGASRSNISQKQRNEYREKLASNLEIRELSARGLLMTQAQKTRASPISEEAMSSSPLLTAALTTNSTESGNTVRSGMTPGPVAGTPSYPFPRMASGGFTPLYLQKSLPSLSMGLRMPQNAGQEVDHKAVQGSVENRGILDQVLSENSTPASNCTSGASPHHENLEFPSPSLQELSLMLPIPKRLPPEEEINEMLANVDLIKRSLEHMHEVVAATSQIDGVGEVGTSPERSGVVTLYGADTRPTSCQGWS